MAFDASTWTDTRTAEETPKRWRNKYRALEDGGTECPACQFHREHAAGSVFLSHCITYATETEAAEMGRASAARIGFAVEYLESIPEGERP